jgi:hypothetical protein
MVTIYVLKCKENGKVYVGCTANKPAKRLREHRCLLRANRHAEPDLQADWNTLGESAFVMETWQTLDAPCVTDKRAAELAAMQHFAQSGLLYNQNRTAFAPTKEAIAKGWPKATATEGRKRSPEANEKRRLAQIGKPKGHGAKISATKRKNREGLMR